RRGECTSIASSGEFRSAGRGRPATSGDARSPANRGCDSGAATLGRAWVLFRDAERELWAALATSPPGIQIRQRSCPGRPLEPEHPSPTVRFECATKTRTATRFGGAGYRGDFAKPASTWREGNLCRHVGFPFGRM